MIGNSMKIGIITDSHDHKDNLKKAVHIFNNAAVEKVVHAGDIVAPFTKRELGKLTMPLVAVFGNNDGERLGLKQVFGDIFVPPLHMTLNEKKIVVMHEPDNLEAVADSGRFDVVIYGHTHAIDIRRGKSLIINPGESCGWLTGKSHIAILDLKNMDYEMIEL
jgi:putative phosphoesterase